MNQNGYRKMKTLFEATEYYKIEVNLPCSNFKQIT